MSKAGSEFDPVLLGERLEEWRSAQRLTQRDVAARSGVSLSSYSRIENGQTPNVGFVDMIRIAEALNLNPEEMAALAGVWTPVMEGGTDPQLKNWLDVVGHKLSLLDLRARTSLMEMMLELIKVQERMAQMPDSYESENSKLPAWMRQRLSRRLVERTPETEKTEEEDPNLELTAP